MSVTVEASQSVVMKEHMPELERLQLRKKRERKGRGGGDTHDTELKPTRESNPRTKQLKTGPLYLAYDCLQPHERCRQHKAE